MSCSSATFCVADDTRGNVLTYDGTSWSSANISDGSNILDAVSCPSSSFCAAVDADGKVLLDTGTSWASATSIDATRTISSVSCPTASFCVAVDTSGNAVKASATTATAQLTWDTNGSLPQVLSDGTNNYVYGPTGEPVEQVNVTTSAPAANPLFLTYTPSDSSWLVTNASGQQVSYYRYDAYGTLAFGTPTSPFGYAGQYADTSSSPSGFDDMRARQYEAQTGQFTTRDPEFELTDEAYGYAGGDPVNGSDPTGLTGGAPDLALCGQTNSCPHESFLSTLEGFVEAVDPAYAAIAGAYGAWETAQDPCSSDWAIAGDSLRSLIGVAGTAAAGLGAGGLAGGFADAAEGGAAAEGGGASSMTTLGLDPATGQFSQSEFETALRIQTERGVTLTRSTDPYVDWVDGNGNTYDAVGNFSSKYFDQQWPNLQARILDHLQYADYVPVDVSEFTPEQIAEVRQFIGPLAPRVSCRALDGRQSEYHGRCAGLRPHGCSTGS